jgi:anti-anti-sigma regulatory factor
MADFRLETVRPRYTCQALLRCSGRLIVGRGAERHHWAAFLDGTDQVDVLLDLSVVTDMDAAGIGIIASLCQSLRRRGGTVRMLAASARVRTLLRVTGVEYALDRPAPPVCEDGGTGGFVREAAAGGRAALPSWRPTEAMMR